MAEETNPKVGIESENNDIPADADVFGFVDDGEHAIVWAVKRTRDDTVAFRRFYCEAGLIDPIRDWSVRHIDPMNSVQEWAEDYAKTNKNEIYKARRHFDQ